MSFPFHIIDLPQLHYLDATGVTFRNFGHVVVKNCGPRRIENLCLKASAFSEVIDSTIESEGAWRI